MATLTIKNVPETLVRRLKQQAVAHRRSLNLEVITCLESIAQATPVDVEAMLARVRAVRVTLRGGVQLTNRMINEAKRQGRP
jgi:plasmid stability protein